MKKAKNAEEPEKMVSESRRESLSFSDREIQLRNLENEKAEGSESHSVRP